MLGVFKEAERIKELEFVVKLRCFSAKIEKTLKNRQKEFFFHSFWSFWKIFQALFNFG